MHPFQPPDRGSADGCADPDKEINGPWKDVYCKTVDSDKKVGVADGDVYTLLILMDIPLRQRAMGMHQAKRNLVQPAIASADL